MSDVAPISYDTLGWALKQINKAMMQKGFVIGLKVDKRNHVIEANLLPIADALECGFNPIQMQVGPEKPKPTPPSTANG